jgi:hypothetical protein
MTTNGDKVTLRDVYQAIGSLEQKLDKRFERVESKVEILEDFRSKLIGVSLIIGAFAGTIASWVWAKIINS